MKGNRLVFLTSLIALMFLIAGGALAQDAIPERGFSATGPTGEGYDVPLAEQMTVGSTVPTFNQTAFVAITAGMAQAAEDFNINLIIQDGENDPNKQLQQVENFIVQGVDAIMIDAVDAVALAPAVLAANEAGIPVMHFDRRVDVASGAELFAFVGSEWILNGVQSGIQAVEALNGAGNVVMIEGVPASSVTHDRRAGFLSVIDNYDDIQVVAAQPGNFNRADAQTAMENILQANPEGIDLVWFMNDEMFLGGLTAIQEAGREGEMILISIDGQKEACQAIADGTLYGTVVLDIFGMGYEPVRAVAQYLNGRMDFPEWIRLFTNAADASNIDQFLPKCF